MSASRYLHGTATVDVCPLNMVRTPERSTEHSLVAVVKTIFYINTNLNPFDYFCAFCPVLIYSYFLCDINLHQFVQIQSGHITFVLSRFEHTEASIVANDQIM